jgi:hypothetical protein
LRCGVKTREKNSVPLLGLLNNLPARKTGASPNRGDLRELLVNEEGV